MLTGSLMKTIRDAVRHVGIRMDTGVSQLMRRIGLWGLLLVIALMECSCASKTVLDYFVSDPTQEYTPLTYRLWELSSKENAIIEVPFSEMPEVALIEDELEYTKDEKKELYYVYRTPVTERDHLVLRVVATPATLLFDGCIELVCAVCLVFGAIGLGGV